MQDISRIVADSFAAGMVAGRELSGEISGEISYRRAAKVFGKWFTDASRQGRIRPCRIDDGRNGTHHYRIVDILKLRTEDSIQAVYLKI